MNLPTQPKTPDVLDVPNSWPMVVSHPTVGAHCAHPVADHDAWGCRTCTGQYPCTTDHITLRRSR